MPTVFVVQHSRKISDDADDVKMIGVYANRADALSAIERLQSVPGFSAFPEIVSHEDDLDEGFFVDEYEVGKDHWVEGFVTA